MSRFWRRFTVLVGAAALTVAAGGAATAGPGPGASSGSTATGQPAAPSKPTHLPSTSASSAPRSVDYRGVRLTVPAGWSVVDLDADPAHCLRLDVKAVYIGRPGSQQDCPAHKVGRAETVWLHPAADRDTTPMTSSTSTVGSLKAHTGRSGDERTKAASFTTRDVQVDGAWGDSEAEVDEVLATAKATATPATSTTSTAVPSAAVAPATFSSTSTSASPSASTSSTALVGPAALTTATTSTTTSTVTSTVTSAPRTFTGMGFDTCAAPSTTTMQKWLGSPYRAMGIYIGGSMRACGDGNLSASWVSQTSSMGWGLIPIYVGVQAPCVNQTGLARIDPKQAAAQGKAAADDAAGRAGYFGLGAGTPVYYDMEGYNNTVAGCTAAVTTFLTAWTQELHARGYTSGAYGSTSSLMVDLSRAIGTTGFTAPDNVWFASWNGLQTLSDSTAFPAFKDAYWSGGQRLHQYSTGSETWGGVTLSIDSNWLGGRVTGNPVPVGYGAGTYGPGSTSFVFTGRMDYWKSNEGSGLQRRAYYTYSTAGRGEENGATWSPSLGTGLYAVDAYVPETRATAKVSYAVSDATGTTTRALDQATLSGWAALGRYVARSGTSVRVHASDNSPSATTAQVGVDAMRFTLVATAPSAPTSVTAVPDNGRATVRWTAATANGSPVTGYTVTASPGGARATVSGTATSATVTGLSNETAYTFTVTATNLVGTGPSSQPSVAVRPSSFSHLVPVASARVLDTRYGTTTNPVRTALAAGGSLTLKVAGVTGSPVPAGATAAVIDLTASAPQKTGYLSAGSSSASTSSVIDFTAGRTVTNLHVGRLSSTGTLTLVNHSGGTVHVIADVTGYLTTSATTNRWTAPAPKRVLDTRYGTTSNSVRTALAAGASLTVRVAGVTGSPVPAGATAAAVDLTTTAPQKGGYLSVGPTAASAGAVTNFPAGRTVTNLLVSRLSSSGTLTVVNHSAGTVHVIADVSGYITTASTSNQWASVAPTAVLDTRYGTTANPVHTALAAGASLTVKIAGVSGSPVPASAKSAAVNVVALAPKGSGRLSVDSVATSSTSTANFVAGQTVGNLYLGRLSSAGTITISNHSSGTVHLAAYVTGYLR